MALSCEKIEKAGEIPGMGDAGGELSATPYTFNSDLTLGEFVGVSPSNLKSAEETEELTIVNINALPQGSGDQVIVEVTIENTSETECRTAWFRAGTVFQVSDPDYQSGILMAPAEVCIGPKSITTIALYLYCLNQGKENSSGEVTYELKGVTDSDNMWGLVLALKGKKVNYEHYTLYPEDESSEYNYEYVKNTIQKIIWIITNGNGNYSMYNDFLNNLPNLPEGYYPASLDDIYNLGATLPNCNCDSPEYPCDELDEQTAFGGDTGFNIGKPGAWWYAFDIENGLTQDIYAGQTIKIGSITYDKDGKTLTINLAGNAILMPGNDESVKIQGYNLLPTKRPSAGHFGYKGTDLIVSVEDSPFYVVHLDVLVCKEP